MQMHGWKVTALDPDAKAIEHIQTKVGCECIHGDFIEIEITEDNRIDLISFNKVLEHVEDPIRMLKKSKALLKDDGIIYLEVLDGENAILEGDDREVSFY